MINQTRLGIFAVIVASLLWSLDGFLRTQLYGLPPAVVVFWEHLFGFLVLLPIIFYTLKAFKKFSRRQWWAITLVSFLSGALGTVLYTAALGKVQFIQFSVVVLMQQLQPLFAISTAALFLREPVSKKFLLLSVIAIVSVYFVSFPDLRVHFGSGTFFAALFALGAAASWGVSTTFSKFSLTGTSFLHVTATRFGLTPLFALAFVFFGGHTDMLFSLEALQWKYILAITFSTGLLALTIYYFGLTRIPASRATIFELTWPLSAVIVGYVFFGDRLALSQWVGACALIIVMFVISKELQSAKSTF